MYVAYSLLLVAASAAVGFSLFLLRDLRYKEALIRNLRNDISSYQELLGDQNRALEDSAKALEAANGAVQKRGPGSPKKQK